MSPPNLYIFFASADWSRSYKRRPIKRRIRLLMRFPKKSYLAFLSWLIRTVTRSRLAHCSIGDGELVLDFGLMGRNHWPHISYCLNYPTLVGAFIVPAPNAIDLDGYRKEKIRVFPTLLRWWSRGRVTTRDCVCETVRFLNEAGVPCPKRIYKPCQLFEWLEKEGYLYVNFS